MGIICEICGKEFKTTQGRRGHMTFVHNMYKSVPDDPVVQQTILQELKVLKNQVERITNKLDMINDLSEEMCILAKGQKQLQSYVYDIQKRNTPDKYCDTLNKISLLQEYFKRLSRYIQLEFAGISDDIIWEFSLSRPKLKKKSKKVKYILNLPDGKLVLR